MLAADVKLVVEFGEDFIAGKDDAVPEVNSVRVGGTEVLSAEPKPIAVAIVPEDDEGVVAGTNSTITDDVRKQTDHCQQYLDPELLRSNYHFAEHWRLERVLVMLEARTETSDGPYCIFQ